jgi:hypothetical protein
MAWTLDARIPVEFLADDALPPGKPAALVSEAPPPPLPAGAVAGVSFEGGVTAHPAACACCQGRSPAAQALDRLFQARTRGACPWFDRVAVTPEAAEAVRAALAEDAVAAARFRPV